MPDDGGDEGPGRPADGDEPLSDKLSEDVEAGPEEEETEPVTSSVDELETTSLAPLDAELIGRLEMAGLDAEFGGSVMETLRLSLLLGPGIPRDSDRVGAPVDEVDTVSSVEVGKTELAVPENELPDAVIDASVLCLVLELAPRLGDVAGSDAGTVPAGEVDAVSAVEDGDKVLFSRLVRLVSTMELGMLLADTEGSEDMPPDVGLEVEDESGTETSVELGGEGPALEDEGPGAVALEIGPLGDEDSVYGPPVDDVSAEDGLPFGAVPVLDSSEGVELAAVKLVATGDESSVLPVLGGLVETRLSVAELGSAEDESDNVEDDSRLDVTDVVIVRLLLVLLVRAVSRDVTVTDESDGLLGAIDEELSSPLERLVYALDTVGDELIVEVSTLVVVRSVIWEVDKFVGIVVTMLVVIVRGRLDARIAELELPTDSGELGAEDEGSVELKLRDEGDDGLAKVEGISSDDDVWVGGTSDSDVADGLGELDGLEGFKLEGAADVGTLDNTVPEDGTVRVEASFEL